MVIEPQVLDRTAGPNPNLQKLKAQFQSFVAADQESTEFICRRPCDWRRRESLVLGPKESLTTIEENKESSNAGE